MFKNAAVVYLSLIKFLPLNVLNVYDYLWRYYGASIQKHFGECIKAHLRLCKLKLDIAFIRTCKRENLIPTFARIRLANRSLIGSKLVKKCSLNILNAELKFKKQIFTQTYKHSVRLDNELKQYVPHIIYLRLKTIFQQIISKKMIETECTHKTKLEKLRINNTKQRSPSKFDIKSVINLSSRTLNIHETNALSNGLHHVYPSDCFDQATFTCNIEYFYARLLNIKTTYKHYEQKPLNEKVVHQLTSIQLNAACELRSAANMIKDKAQIELKNIGAQYKTSVNVLKNLAKDRSIIITKPDKGRGVVIMNRSDYIEKMEVILNDSLTFKAIDYDPTIDNENRLVRLLLQMKKENFITENECNLAKPIGSRPARLYGLPKLHKNNYPLRPVMSATKTVGYGLGKVLAKRLSHLRSSPYMVKDSFDFVNKIKASEHTGKTMVSFDVVSLFTKIPLEYTLNLILDKLYPTCKNECLVKKNIQKTNKTKNKENKKCTSCDTRKKFKTLLEFVTSEVNFLFNGKMYVQHNGVAMGSPLAPVIADIFMGQLEATLMEQLKMNGIQDWYRFVDDTFVLMNPTTNIDDILVILNSFHESIKFTYEVEKKNSLSFLDVMVCRIPEQSKFETKIYRKSTYTGLLTKWNSFVPIEYKKASIVNMVQRAIKICSNYHYLASEFDRIRKIGKANSYPLSFIEQKISIGLNKYMQNKTKTNIPEILPPKQKMYFEVPYIGNTTELLKKNLKRIVAKCRPDIDAQFYTKILQNVQHFFKVKDPVDKYMQSNIVYCVKCKDCEDVYVGKTERQLIRRLIEHGAPKQLLHNTINKQQPTYTYSIYNTTNHTTAHTKTTTTVHTTDNTNDQQIKSDTCTDLKFQKLTKCETKTDTLTPINELKSYNELKLKLFANTNEFNTIDNHIIIDNSKVNLMARFNNHTNNNIINSNDTFYTQYQDNNIVQDESRLKLLITTNDIITTTPIVTSTQKAHDLQHMIFNCSITPIKSSTAIAIDLSMNDNLKFPEIHEHDHNNSKLDETKTINTFNDIIDNDIVNIDNYCNRKRSVKTQKISFKTNHINLDNKSIDLNNINYDCEQSLTMPSVIKTNNLTNICTDKMTTSNKKKKCHVSTKLQRIPITNISIHNHSDDVTDSDYQPIIKNDSMNNDFNDINCTADNNNYSDRQICDEKQKRINNNLKNNLIEYIPKKASICNNHNYNTLFDSQNKNENNNSNNNSVLMIDNKSIEIFDYDRFSHVNGLTDINGSTDILANNHSYNDNCILLSNIHNDDEVAIHNNSDNLNIINKYNTEIDFTHKIKLINTNNELIQNNSTYQSSNSYNDSIDKLDRYKSKIDIMSLNKQSVSNSNKNNLRANCINDTNPNTLTLAVVEHGNANANAITNTKAPMDSRVRITRSNGSGLLKKPDKLTVIEKKTQMNQLKSVNEELIYNENINKNKNKNKIRNNINDLHKEINIKMKLCRVHDNATVKHVIPNLTTITQAENENINIDSLQQHHDNILYNTNKLDETQELLYNNNDNTLNMLQFDFERKNRQSNKHNISECLMNNNKNKNTMNELNTFNYNDSSFVQSKSLAELHDNELNTTNYYNSNFNTIDCSNKIDNSFFNAACQSSIALHINDNNNVFNVHDDIVLNDDHSKSKFHDSNNNDHNTLRRSERIKNKNKNKTLSKNEIQNVIDSSSSANIIINEEKSQSNTAISKHEIDMKHNMDWNRVQVVWSDNNNYKLLIKESLIIQAHQPSLNRTTHSIPLYIYPEGIKERHIPTIKSYK